MIRTTRALAAALAPLLLAATGALAEQTPTRTVVDGAGRTVVVPAKIERVYAAGPPASVILYTLAPEKLLGWTRAPRPDEQAFMPPKYAALPELGRLTGRANTANVETVLRLRPDLILDVGSTAPTYASLADRVQEQTGLPYVLLDGRFANTVALYRTLGDLVGAPARAKELADYAERTMAEIDRRIATVPADKRPRVYYGRGPNGLETGLAGSINMEILERVGAVNVAAAAGRGGLTTVSREQVLAWNPDVILALDTRFPPAAEADPVWQALTAVRERRIYVAPKLPFGWFDSPPGVNRLIGLRWLAKVLYPALFPEDLRQTTREFYRLFYHVELSAAQLDELLGPAR
ncbi:MAG TPA: iron ABC transporter substrate-binding protein [Alphaproteobacteria bacterium]|jgi:iron complex transport system substrate-binding protein|nr:iron ABC transporter substrate-binding protein [Alphaproteobacteria bacterium]